MLKRTQRPSFCRFCMFGYTAEETSLVFSLVCSHCNLINMTNVKLLPWRKHLLFIFDGLSRGDSDPN